MTGNRSKTVRIIEIAELLGVTKQRAHQIADENGFPAPVAEDLRGRLWDRREVTAWAKVWRARNPCVSRRSAIEIRVAAIHQAGPR